MDEKNGTFQLEYVKCELKVSNISIKQLKAKEAVRILEVHVCPQLQWDEQYKVMKEKIIESIAKINNTEIKICLPGLHFNACLIKKVFFGRGVINLADRKDKELRKLYETAISKKIRVGSNFPRASLYSRKNAV